MQAYSTTNAPEDGPILSNPEMTRQAVANLFDLNNCAQDYLCQ